MRVCGAIAAGRRDHRGKEKTPKCHLPAVVIAGSVENIAGTVAVGRGAVEHKQTQDLILRGRYLYWPFFTQGI